MATDVAPADATAWPRDELMRLVQAWGEVLDPPREREKLSGPELLRLHSRFEELCGRRGGRLLISMERQRLRLVETLKRIRAFDHGEGSSGGLTWFQLPRDRREELLALDGDAVLPTIDETIFHAVERVCRDEPLSTDTIVATGSGTDATEAAIGGVGVSETEASTRMLSNSSNLSTASRYIVSGSIDVPSKGPELQNYRNQVNEARKAVERAGEDRRRSDLAAAAEALAGLPSARVPSDSETPLPPSMPVPRRELVGEADMLYDSIPSLKWRLRDELELIHAWDYALVERVHNNEPCFMLDELVLDRYTALCEPNEESAISIGAKRHRILGAFESLREYLRSRPMDAPRWFRMSVSQRLAEQKANGYQQGFACTLEAPEFNRLSSIVENERRLDQINREALRSTTSEPEARVQPFRGEPVSDARRGDPQVRRPTTDRRDHLPSRYRSAADIADSAVLVSLRHSSKRRRTTHSSSQQRKDEDSDSEGKDRNQGAPEGHAAPINLMDHLVQAQSRRLELLLEEFREERRQEREQTHELLLLLLARVDAVPRSDVAALEALVEQQRRHLEQLFELIEMERETEWEHGQELLHELEGGWRSRR